MVTTDPANVTERPDTVIPVAGDEGVILTQQDGIVGVDPQRGIFNSIDRDIEFTGAFRATGVADGNVAIDAVVLNPNGSGVDVYLDMNISTGGQAHLDLQTDITIDTAGTDIPVIPNNVNTGTTPATTLEQGGSYTTNGETLESVLPGSSREGGPATTQGQPSSVPGIAKLSPGDSLRYTATNQSGGTASFSITPQLVELPV